MKYLKIQNNGELDIRLVALMGGTTKANDKYKIGQFGTGLKYTLAYLFRKNLQFKIFSGKNEINVSLDREEIKDEVFEIICINGNRTSITTKMGAEWSAWMIIRELWCNALDEGGAERDFTYSDNLTDVYEDVKEGQTTFYIQVNEEIEEVINNWKDYFVHDQQPLWENELYAIHESTGTLKLYKQGVLIYSHPETESLFNYDIKTAQINELREFKGVVSLEVLNALSRPSKEVINYFLRNVTEKHYEGSEMDYDWFHSFSEIWKETIGGKKVSYFGGGGSEEEIPDFDNIIKLPKKVYKALTKSFEGIGAINVSDSDHEFYEVFSQPLKEKTDEAISILKKCNYEIRPEYKFLFGFFENKKVLSGKSQKNKAIYISEACMHLPMNDYIFEIVQKNEMLKSGGNNNLADQVIRMYLDTILTNNEVEIQK